MFWKFPGGSLSTRRSADQKKQENKNKYNRIENRG
jgi:hypothetical protein